MPEHRLRDRGTRLPDGVSAPAMIGPNAALQLAAAMTALAGKAETERLFAAAGLSGWLLRPPGEMVSVAQVERLYAVLFRDWPGQALGLCEGAGRRTADYVIANRIPPPARAALRLLPAGIAARLLSRAVARNAWTFVGGGRLLIRPGRPLTFVLQGHALAFPGCPWHRAVFRQLFRAFINPRASVDHASHAGPGGAGDMLIVNW